MPAQKISNLKQQSSTITIEEKGDATKNGRTLILRGSTMPLMGAAWATEQNIQTTWYPGNSDDATQQVLGSRELPSTWSGEWHRTMMGDDRAEYTDESNQTTFIVNPMTMREIFDSFLRGGSLLVVTWRVEGQVANGQIYSSGQDLLSDNVQDENWSIIRAGRIKSMQTPIMSHTDIQWSIQFDWNGRGGTVARTVNTESEPNLHEDTQELLRKVNKFVLDTEAKKRKISTATTSLTLGKIEAYGAKPAAAFLELRSKMQLQINDFKRATGVARRLASQPQSLLASGATFARATANIMAKAHDDITRIPTELLTSKATPIATARAHRQVNTSLDEAIQIARESRSVRDKLAKDSQSASLGDKIPRKNGRNSGASVIATHVCREGDTPTSISIKYFKSPDHAVDILQANKLPWHLTQLQIGKILIIPSSRNQQGATE